MTAVYDVLLPPDGDEAVRELARAGIAGFHREGIDLEIVRSRPDCLVLRSSVRPPVDPMRGRALVSEWLGSLPRRVHGIDGTVLETPSAPPDGRRSIHTLLWSTRSPSQTPAPIAMTPPVPAPPAALGRSPSVLPPAGALPPSTSRVGLGSPPPGWPAGPPRPGPPGGPAHPVVAGGPPWVPGRPERLPVPRPAVPDVGWRPEGDEIGGNRPLVAGSSGTARSAGIPMVDAAPGDQGGARGPAPAGGGRSLRPRRRWAWIRRRGWMLALGLVAGAAGGVLASGHGTPSYGATSVLVVQSGASTQGPGSANDAEQLAITYAALIPEDKQLIDQAARALGTSPAAVTGHLQVEAEAGTALLQLRYTAVTPNAAVTGANEVAHLLTATVPPGHAIPAGSVAVVTPPSGAALSGSLHKYGLPLGVLLGLLVGLVAAVVAERVDRRVDDLEALGDGVGCPVTAVPGGISATELAAALQRDVDPPVTVVPLRPQQAATATDLAQALSAAWPARVGRPAAGLGPVFAEAPEAMGVGDGATVVVVGAGERLGVVHEMAERLRLVGRDPAWAVLDFSAPARAGRAHGI